MEGRKLRDEGIEKVSEGWAWWLEKARMIATTIANHNGEVTSDEVRMYCPIPPGAHHNLMGAVFRDRRFRAVGFVQSTRPAAHGRFIRVYSLRGEE